MIRPVRMVLQSVPLPSKLILRMEIDFAFSFDGFFLEQQPVRSKKDKQKRFDTQDLSAECKTGQQKPSIFYQTYFQFFSFSFIYYYHNSNYFVES